MYSKCCIPGCQSRRGDCFLHKMPKCEKRLRKWLFHINSDELKNKNLNELRSLQICHKHFEARFVTGKSRIMTSGYPSLFLQSEIHNGIPTKSLSETPECMPLFDHVNNAREFIHNDHNYIKLLDPTEELPSTPDTKKSINVIAEVKAQILLKPTEEEPSTCLSGNFDATEEHFGALEHGEEEPSTYLSGNFDATEEYQRSSEHGEEEPSTYLSENFDATEEYQKSSEHGEEESSTSLAGNFDATDEYQRSSEHADYKMTLQIQNNICHGCLSENRKLLPIKTYYNIYQSIMTDTIQCSNNMNEPLMCWECRAILRNVVKFKQKVLQAQKYLTGMYKYCQKKSLSNLNTTHYHNMSETFHTPKEEIMEIKIEPYCNKNTNIRQETDTNTNNNNNNDDDDDDDESKHKNNTEQNDYMKQESHEDIEDLTAIDNDQESGVKIDKKKHRDEKKFKIVYLTHKADNLMYTRMKINEQERLRWTCIDLSKTKYRLSHNKCESCIVGFNSKGLYFKHISSRHNEARGMYICKICKVILPRKSMLYYHIKEHYTKYLCNVCQYQCYHDYQIRRHLVRAHKRRVECLKCGRRFEYFNDFQIHYKESHTKFTCDYCGLSLKKKEHLISHISDRHGDNKCKECNKTYKSQHALARHVNLYHVKSASELCYCVECNIQFDNVALYTRHLKRSFKHRVFTRYSCPECNKVYHRRISMMNHFNYVHMQKTKYYCEVCCRFFLNGNRLRQHFESIHLKVSEVKDKMCPYCDKGFSTNRTLENHIRIHTGERPFACDHCTAKFRLRQTLVKHTRAIHKIL